MSDLHIKYERTGGFAGLKLAASFELDDLPDEQEKQLRNLLNELDFFKLPVQILPARPGSDQFTHKIEVEGKKGKHAVLTTDSAAPEKLRELIDLLNTIARTHRKKD
ncbi:MAG: hypothetical protein Fur0016_09500 [Anaerolineales bacterium]